MNEDKLDRIAEGVAKIEARTDGLKEYIKEVSDNQKATARDLKGHIQNNTSAHGLDIREKGSEKWIAWSGLLLAGVTLVTEIALHWR